MPSADWLLTDAPCDDEITYTVARADELLWEYWGSTVCVFAPVSGETHVLNELPAEILRRLCESPASVKQLAVAFAAECGLEDTRDLRSKLSSIIAELSDLELIDPTAE